jgi:ABC transporter substrate binding protein
MAAELVSLNVDVLVSIGNVASPYAKKATTKIPVVFTLVADPVGMKLVDSFARPGANVTGISTYSSDVIGRRLQLLKETLPGLSRFAQFVNPAAQSSRFHIDATRAAAEELGLIVQTFEARSLDGLEPAFDAMANAGMQAVTVNQEGLPFQGRAVIAKLALAIWERKMIKLIAVAFTLALATSTHAMPVAPLHQSDGITEQVRYGCGPGRTRVAGRCVARTTIRHTRRVIRRNVRGY